MAGRGRDRHIPLAAARTYRGRPRHAERDASRRSQRPNRRRRRLHHRPAAAAGRRTACGRHPPRRPVRGQAPHHRQQGGRHGRPPRAGTGDRHAGQRPAPPLRAGADGHRRRRPSRHRPPARQGHLRRDGRRQDGSDPHRTYRHVRRPRHRARLPRRHARQPAPADRPHRDQHRPLAVRPEEDGRRKGEALPRRCLVERSRRDGRRHAARQGRHHQLPRAADLRAARRHRNAARRRARRMPARDGPHPPDPRSPGAHRRASAGRPDLRQAPLAEGRRQRRRLRTRDRRRQGVRTAGAARLHPGFRASDHEEGASP